MKPRALALLASLAVLACTTAAGGEEAIRAVRLEYTVDPAASRCPSEQVFRDNVGAQLRFDDPFVKEAPVRLIVTVSYRAGRYHGRAELLGAREPWSHEVTPPLRDCRTLIDVLASYVVNRLDPPGPPSKSHDTKPAAGPPSNAPPAAPSPAGPPSNAPPVTLPPNLAPALDQPSRKVLPARWVQFRVGAAGNVALFSAPSDVAFEGAVEVGVRFGPWLSLSGEFRGSPPVGTTFPLESPLEGAVMVSTYRLGGALVPCFHWPLSTSRLKSTPLACAVIQAGAAFAFGNGLESGPPMPYWAAGGRLAFELELIKWLTARLGADFLAVPLRPRIHLLEQQLWAAPAFSMAIGTGLVVSLP